MKKLLLVCFLLSSNFLFAQVQLDSVVITDTYSSEVLITYAYNYDSQGLLSGFTEAEEELKVEVINNSLFLITIQVMFRRLCNIDITINSKWIQLNTWILKH